jgi:hypothetical protein
MKHQRSSLSIEEMGEILGKNLENLEVRAHLRTSFSSARETMARESYGNCAGRTGQISSNREPRGKASPHDASRGLVSGEVAFDQERSN